MSRGFYSVAASVFAEKGEDTKTPAQFGCIVLATHATKLYLHSAENPNEALEAAGGVLLADDWPVLKAALTVAVRDKVFRTLVQREVADPGTPAGTITVTLFIPRVAVQPGDVVVSEWMPPHKFLGDPDPVPVP